MGERRRSDGNYRHTQPTGHLAALCWCRRITVSVPRIDILAGLTCSCGHHDCDTLDHQHRTPKGA